MKVMITGIKKIAEFVRPWASLLGGLFHLIASMIYLAANHGWL